MEYKRPKQSRGFIPLKIQVFDPFANIWSHSYPVARVMKALTNNGHLVEVVRCEGIFSSHCIAMSGANVDYAASRFLKSSVCRSCRKRSNLLSESDFALESLFESHVETGDIDLAQRTAMDCNTENWRSFRFRNIPVGAIASYEILLKYKTHSEVLPTIAWPEFQSNLINTVLVVIVSQRILSETQPDRVLVYNSLYALNNAYVSVASSLGIPTYTLQGGPHIVHRPTTLTCFTSANEMFLTTYSPEAKEWLESPIDGESIAIVSEHLQGLLSGESAFAYSDESSAQSRDAVVDRLSLNSERPVLLALLSSEDELFAASVVDSIPRVDGWVSVFESQSDWLRWLIDFATRHKDVDVVFRVHPRLLPNKRENKTSAYFAELNGILSDVPANVRVNWPSDEISLYDLMQFTDVVLNRRSSAGVEFMAYGLPVVLPGNEYLFSCPPELCLVAHDEETYEKLIHQAIETGWSIENVRKAYRWLGFLFRSTCIEVLTTNKSSISAHRPKKGPLKLALWRIATFVYLQFGFLRKETGDMVRIPNDLNQLEHLVATIIDLREGIHQIRKRHCFPSSKFEQETTNLVADLGHRLSLLSSGQDVQSPILAKFRNFNA
jgi:hypothetical protein